MPRTITGTRHFFYLRRFFVAIYLFLKSPELCCVNKATMVKCVGILKDDHLKTTMQSMTIFMGHGLVWWTGMVGGFFFLLLIITALTKQYNYNIFTKVQVPLTPFHHWFGWLCFGIFLVHFLLALFSSVFFVFF